MTLSLIDRSNYFRGLLILVGKDKNVSNSEREIIIELGKTLGFDKEFCVDSINNLLNNKYIIETPPKFTDTNIAKSFLLDGLKIAKTDDAIRSVEMEWLKKVAFENNIEPNWLDKKVKEVEAVDYRSQLNQLEVSVYIF